MVSPSAEATRPPARETRTPARAVDRIGPGAIRAVASSSMQARSTISAPAPPCSSATATPKIPNPANCGQCAFQASGSVSWARTVSTGSTDFAQDLIEFWISV